MYTCKNDGNQTIEYGPVSVIFQISLDYLDPGYSTNGNLTIFFSDSDATSDFSTSHR